MKLRSTLWPNNSRILEILYSMVPHVSGLWYASSSTNRKNSFTPAHIATRPTSSSSRRGKEKSRLTNHGRALQ